MRKVYDIEQKSLADSPVWLIVLIGLALPTFSTIGSNGTKWNQKLVQYVIDAVESIHRGNAGHEFRSQAFAAQ